MRNRFWIVILCWLLASVSVAAENRPDQWVEAKLDTSQVYVQAQAIYRLRFYQALPLQELQMKPPLVRLAEVVPVGELNVFEMERDGRRYRVNEQLYSISPLVSGELQLAGAQVSARRPGQSQNILTWSVESLTLKVLPVPSTEAPDYWLPASDVELTEQWGFPEQQPEQQTAITRQITIRVVGVNATQIPDIAMSIPGVLVQPQSPKRENNLEEGQIVAVLSQKFVLYPLTEKQVTAPPLSLAWWNTQTESAELAQLPKRNLLFKHQSLPSNNRTTTPTIKTSIADEETKQAQTSGLRLSTIVIFSLLFFVTLSLLVQPAGFYQWWLVLRASYGGDPRQISDALLSWVQVLWPQSAPQTIAALAAMLDDSEAKNFLIGLERELYGPENQGSNDHSSVIAIYKVRQSVLRARKDLSG